MRKLVRAAALIAAVAAFLMLVASPFVLAVQRDHDCCGGPCEVCARMAALQRTLRLAVVIIFLAAAAVALYGMVSWIRLLRAGDAHIYPALYKVKLLN